MRRRRRNKWRGGHHTNGCCWSLLEEEGLFLVGEKRKKQLEIRLQSCEMPQHTKINKKIQAVQQFHFLFSRNKNKKEYLCVLHTIPFPDLFFKKNTFLSVFLLPTGETEIDMQPARERDKLEVLFLSPGERELALERRLAFAGVGFALQLW